MPGLENDTQPFPNPDQHRRRSYVPAVWSPGGGPGGSPKVSGGYEVDSHGAIISTRGLNRKDQRYEQSEAVLQANRDARAASELPTTLFLRDADDQIGVRTASGNNYDVSYPVAECDCPDLWRLRESGKTTVSCKHMVMVVSKLADIGGVDNLNVSCEYVAGKTGFSVRAIQQLCERGFFAAFKTTNVWEITGQNDGTLNTEIADLLARVVVKPGWAQIDDIIIALT